MKKIKVKIDNQWVEVEPHHVKTDDHHFLQNEAVEKLKKEAVISKIDAYARGKVGAAFLQAFPGAGVSPVANMFQDRFEYDLETGDVYLKDHDGYAADEHGRITLKRYFDHRPELLQPLK